MARAKKIPCFLIEKEFQHLINCYLYQSKKRIGAKCFFTRFRNVISWCLEYYNGLRPKESSNIKIEDLNITEKEIYIPAENNKQRNQDYMPIRNDLLDKLIAYLKLRDKMFPNSPYLFPSTWNSEKPVYRGTLMRAFVVALEKANFKKTSYNDSKGNKRLNFSQYSLRHSFGTFAMHSVKDNKQVAKLLRHYDPQCRSTYIYTHTDQMLSRRELLEKVSFK
jgi:integrase